MRAISREDVRQMTGNEIGKALEDRKASQQRLEKIGNGFCAAAFALVAVGTLAIVYLPLAPAVAGAASIAIIAGHLSGLFTSIGLQTSADRRGDEVKLLSKAQGAHHLSAA